MWLRSDEPEAAPRHTTARFGVEPLGPGLVTIAAGEPMPAVAGQPTASLPLRVRGAVCRVGRLAAGSMIALPDAARLHVFVVEGEPTLTAEAQSVRLGPGDSVLATSVADVSWVARTHAAVIVWTWADSVESADDYITGAESVTTN
jgi:hypothetical protein